MSLKWVIKDTWQGKMLKWYTVHMITKILQPKISMHILVCPEYNLESIHI